MSLKTRLLRQRIPHSSTSPARVTSLKPAENGTPTWKELNNLCIFLFSTSRHDLEPIFTSLVRCIEMWKNTTNGIAEYDATMHHTMKGFVFGLWTNMETTFAGLKYHLSQNVCPATTPSCRYISNSITRELEITRRSLDTTQLRGTTGEYERSIVINFYRNINDHLNLLLLNVNSAKWGADEATMNLVNSLPYAGFARYSFRDQALVPLFITSTRPKIHDQIKDWIQDLNQKIAIVYWINGMAGTGKSTIAYQLCEYLDNNFSLAASFFCSQPLPECRNAELIIPSIAYQLALFSYPYRHALAHIIKEDPSAYLHQRGLDKQFDVLITKPLRKAQKAFPARPLVVIDALDECEDKEVAGELVRVLLAQPPDLPVKFVLSSRPEPNIRDQFTEHSHSQGKWLGITLHEDLLYVNQDILDYLQVNLGQTGLSGSQIAGLAQRAEGWFAYAAAMVQYIIGYGHNSQISSLRARSILQASVLDQINTINFQEIDMLYADILRAVFADLSVTQADIMRQVLNTVICAPGSISAQMMANLLKMDTQRIHAALSPFSSVLFIEGTAQSITPLHKSFSEYLFDPTRSKEYHCNATVHHSFLARRCFDYIRDSRPLFNVCKLESSYLLDVQVVDLDKRVTESITPQVLYACQHWGFHMCASSDTNNLLTRLEEFLANHLLLWLEILNLNKNINKAVAIISSAEKWVIQNLDPSETMHLVKAASRFVAAIAKKSINQSTPHIYVSALPSLALSDPVRRHYDLAFLPMTKRQTGGQVYSTAFSPDGTKLALGTGNDVQILDALNGRLLAQPFKGHTWSVMSVVFSPDGAMIASGSRDKTIRLWDSQSGKVVLRPLIGHTGHVRVVLFSSDGTIIISGSNDSTIRVWDVQSGRPKFEPLIGHTDYVKSIAISSNNSRIVSGSKDGTIRVWDLHSGHPLLGPLKGHTDYITSVSLSPNDLRIISASADRTIRIWDSETGQPLLSPVAGHDDWVLSATSTVNGAYVISSSSDCSIRLWDATTGKLLKKLPKIHESHIFSLACSPDGSRFVSGSGDESICLWNTNPYAIGIKSSITNAGQGHTQAIHCICVCPNGIYLASGSSDMNIYIWNLHEKRVAVGPLEGHAGRVNSVCFTPEGNSLLSGSSDGTIRLWDAQTGIAILHPLEERAAEICSLACSKSGGMIASGSSTGTVSVWSLSTGERLLGPLKGHRGSVQSVNFSPDSTRVVTGSVDRTICVREVQSGHIVLGPLTSYTAGIRSVVFSPDGLSIVSGSDDRAIRFWDAQTGKPARPPLIGHTNRVLSIQFSPDGNQIVSGSEDQTIRIWNVHTGSLVLEPLRGHTGSVSSVAFLPNGTQVVSASSDMAIRVWDIQSCPPSAPTSNHSKWDMDTEGWIVDTHDRSKRLTWLDPNLRASILAPRNTVLLSREGHVELDFSDAKIGESWTELHQPFETRGK
ncbi:unnamed protein product [Rhizoctonia solani]|uniref:Nephrocystin 3-like N-terminal domain-containing protein n=1 Tax=Rhizoctonia solani TaxID=456999 RepID=A0A8H3DIA0_9AGAM|nr:unnamed protein product [Rhizoctonia solani]